MFAVSGSIITLLLGEWNIVLEILLIFIVIDYITGVAAAIKNKTLRSNIGYEGIMKKAAILLVVILAAQLDRIAGTAGFFRSATAFFFIANEGLSILENIGEFGVLYPSFIKNHLEQLRDKNESPDKDWNAGSKDEMTEEEEDLPNQRRE